MDNVLRLLRKLITATCSVNSENELSNVEEIQIPLFKGILDFYSEIVIVIKITKCHKLVCKIWIFNSLSGQTLLVIIATSSLWPTKSNFMIKMFFKWNVFLETCETWWFLESYQGQENNNKIKPLVVHNYSVLNYNICQTISLTEKTSGEVQRKNGKNLHEDLPKRKSQIYHQRVKPEYFQLL